MPIASRSELLRSLAFGGAGLAMAVGLAGTAAIQMRGPDMDYVPAMADRPVVMIDGSAFFAQVHEVTIAEWNRCTDAGACALRLRPPPAAADADYPATGLNWVDVSQYVAWLNEMSNHEFRLPSRAEWQAMASAVLPEAPEPIFTDPNLTWASAYLTEGLGERRLRPTGSYSLSPEGVADLDGNVWEWTAECYRGEGISAGNDCPAFHVGGEHDAVVPYLVRDPARGGCAAGSPPAHLGMRLVTDDPLPAS